MPLCGQASENSTAPVVRIFEQSIPSLFAPDSSINTDAIITADSSTTDTDQDGILDINEINGDSDGDGILDKNDHNLTVINTNDSGTGSLRDIITRANAQAGDGRITFAIPGTGPHVITINSKLPDLSKAGVEVDARTQSGTECSLSNRRLQIQLNALNTDNTAGLTLTNENQLVAGLSITNSDRFGIRVNRANNATIICNHLGTDSLGQTAQPNASHALYINNSQQTSVGTGSDSGANLISGNSSSGIYAADNQDTSINYNFVGTNLSGTAILANQAHGIAFYRSNTINITNNLISGNGADGIYLSERDQSINATVSNNKVGTDISGQLSLPNTQVGIDCYASNDIKYSQNIISGNSAYGLRIAQCQSLTIDNNKIGTNIDGTSAIPNRSYGAVLTSTSVSDQGNLDVVFSNNTISGNGSHGIYAIVTDTDPTENLSVIGNLIGTDSSGQFALSNGGYGLYLRGTHNARIGDGSVTGQNIISGNNLAGMSLNGETDSVFNKNIIGANITGTTAIPNGQSGGSGSDGVNVRNGDNYIFRSNQISGNNRYGMLIFDGVNRIELSDNLIGLASDGTTAMGNKSHGIITSSNSSTILLSARQNRIAYNGSRGITSGALVTTLSANAIYANADQGIDIGNNGVTINDAGDTDSGSNDFLNYPEPVFVAKQGNNLSAKLKLDMPSGRYRIEAFDNPSGLNSNGYGEGEIYLGFVETDVTAPYSSDSTLIFNDTDFSAPEKVTFTATLIESGTLTISSEFSNAVSPLLDSDGDGITDVIECAVIPCDSDGDGIDDHLDTDSDNDGVLDQDEDSGDSDNDGIIDRLDHNLQVTNTNDSGAGSLRDNITRANTQAGANKINFAIPGTGPHKITLSSSLPTLVKDGISIDASTQAGSQCDINNRNLQIEINGNDTVSSDGLALKGDDQTLVGLSLTGFIGNGISISSEASNSNIICNHIGVDASGQTVRSNSLSGIDDRGTGSHIGDNTDTGINVISGNKTYGLNLFESTQTSVLKNHIGLDYSGSLPLSNSSNGVYIQESTNSTINNNIISGNNAYGLLALSDENSMGLTLQGNLIGLSKDGSTAIPNQQHGIAFVAANNILFENNVVSGNKGIGVSIEQSQNITLRNNNIGTDQSGRVAHPNGSTGINIGASSSSDQGNKNIQIEKNLIAANQSHGLHILGNNTDPSSDIFIYGNTIGLNQDGDNKLPNANGLIIDGGQNITIGDGSINNRNIISGNTNIGLQTANSDNIIIRGNYFGSNESGNAFFPNLSDNLLIQNANNTRIGQTGDELPNVISGGRFGVRIDNSQKTNLHDALIGVMPDSETAASLISSAVHIIASTRIDTLNIKGNTLVNSAKGLVFSSSSTTAQAISSDVNVSGNWIGLLSDDTSQAGNGIGVEVINFPRVNFGPNNTVAYNTGQGILFSDSGGRTEHWNNDWIIHSNRIENNAQTGINIQFDQGYIVRDNTIKNNGGNAISAKAVDDLVITQNRISGNTGIGVDLGDDGPTVNDSGDTDTGSNDLLNHPLPLIINTDNNTFRVIAQLDTPPGDYRLEAFDNPNGLDTLGFGEGEVYLASADVSVLPNNNIVIADFTASSIPTAERLTFTATQLIGGSAQKTSEFSSPVALNEDTDSDGIPNTQECLTTTCDDDNDGIFNFLDVDSDGDGILDSVEGITDSDNDNTPDFLDTDSDNDGLSDTLETTLGTNPRNSDSDGDGVNDADEDSDQDGLSNAIELTLGSLPNSPDSNNNGISDGEEDSDQDGLIDAWEMILGLNPLDTDSDGNGISDADEDNDGDQLSNLFEIRLGTNPLNPDTDGDGINDNREDADADSLHNQLEGATDSDGDGVIDALDLDSDNDGLPDILEAPFYPNQQANNVDSTLTGRDFDGDGILDFRDLDSDNDLIPDSLEQGYPDEDGNGILDTFTDLNQNGLDDNLENPPINALDTDLDNFWNGNDLDSNNNGEFDLIEAGYPEEASNGQGQVNLQDQDNDGIPDAADVDLTNGEDIDQDGIDDRFDSDFSNQQDSDFDGLIDQVDLDTNGDGFYQPFEATISTSEANTRFIETGLTGSGNISPHHWLFFLALGASGVARKREYQRRTPSVV